jgi:hypothetical protein
MMLQSESHQGHSVLKGFDPKRLAFKSKPLNIPTEAVQIAFLPSDNLLPSIICLPIFQRDVVPCLKYVKSSTVDISAAAASNYCGNILPDSKIELKKYRVLRDYFHQATVDTFLKCRVAGAS